MRKFHRTQGKRRLFLKILANNLIMKEKMTTTEARAKEIRPMVERLVTYAKKQNLAARRLVLAQIGEKAARKLMSEIAPDFAKRNGGYTRILRLGQRRSDGAEMVIIEFVK